MKQLKKQFLSFHQGVFAQRTTRFIIAAVQQFPYIKAYTVSRRLQDRVAGAFVKNSTYVIPLQKNAASRKINGAAGLRRSVVMDKISWSLFGIFENFHMFLFLTGDNRAMGFSDMGPMSSLISHKTATNGIPAVRTIASGMLPEKISYFFSNIPEGAVAFSLT